MIGSSVLPCTLWRIVKSLLLESDLVTAQGFPLVLEESSDVLIKELCAEQKLLSKSRRDWKRSEV